MITQKLNIALRSRNVQHSKNKYKITITYHISYSLWYSHSQCTMNVVYIRSANKHGLLANIDIDG